MPFLSQRGDIMNTSGIFRCHLWIFFKPKCCMMKNVSNLFFYNGSNIKICKPGRTDIKCQVSGWANNERSAKQSHF